MVMLKWVVGREVMKMVDGSVLKLPRNISYLLR
jgi:hypothetical protein